MIGPAHRDAEDIGFPMLHYHVDPRFLTETQVRWQRRQDREYSSVDGVFNLPLSLEGAKKRSSKINPKFANVTFGLHPRLCRREVPEFSFPTTTPWLPALERRYAGQELIGDCRVCPHRGIPLASFRATEGVLTCPGHGLRWRGGRLVRVASLEEPR